MRRLILRSHQSPGDVLMLTAAVRDLHAAHPGQFQTDVRTSAAAIWQHNPCLTRLQEGQPGIELLDMHYPLVHESNQRPYHFLHGYAQYLEQQLGLKIPLTRFRGDIYLSPAEKEAPPPGSELGVNDPFWIIMAGGKHDFTAKWWNPVSYQKVVDHFQGKIQFVQCGEEGHWHPPLEGVINLIGKTNLRDFIRLMYHAEGVVCPVTFAMHLAPAVEPKQGRVRNRACVVIAGGREPPHWEAYPTHQFISTNGALSCCLDGGCWKSRCQQVGDGDNKDHRDVCEQPVAVSPDLRIPRCLEMITPEEVIRRIEMHFDGGVLHYRNGKPKSNGQLNTAHSPQPIELPEHSGVSIPVSQANDNPPKQREPEPMTQLSDPFPPQATQKKTHVLIRFRHGLGDAVQLTSVVRHLKHYHPDWSVDVAALTGKDSSFHGLANQAFNLERDEVHQSRYDHVYDLDWPECPNCYADCPSTKAERCLLDVFRLTPIPDLCRYSIETSNSVVERARDYLEQTCQVTSGKGGRYPVVLIHYEGNTSAAEKNLPHSLIAEVCEDIIEMGYVPIILDWDFRCPLPDGERIHNPHADLELWGGMGTGDAEALAALTELSSLMIGIDSGPLHVAGATTTPTIGVWTGHHPLHYFAHADNVTHLLPANNVPLLNGDRAIGERYFRKNYRYQTYRDLEQGLRSLVAERLQGGDGGLVFTRDYWIRTSNAEQDLVVVQDIAEEDSYHIDELPMPRPVVVDVGAHIGCFSKRLHQRNPLARIIAVECCAENVPVLKKNIGEFATIVKAAVTYEKDVALLNAVYPDCVSTGGSTIISREHLKQQVTAEQVVTEPSPSMPNEYWADFRPMKTVTLEQLMQEYGFDYIDVLKLDCEGSEFSILGETPSLDKIGVICGEYHGKERFLKLVEERFADWKLQILHDGELGTFWLTSPTTSQTPAPQQPTIQVESPVEQIIEQSSPAPKTAQQFFVTATRNQPTIAHELLLIEGDQIVTRYEHPQPLRGLAEQNGTLWTIDATGELFQVTIQDEAVQLSAISQSPVGAALDLVACDGKLLTAGVGADAVVLYDPIQNEWTVQRPWMLDSNGPPQADCLASGNGGRPSGKSPIPTVTNWFNRDRHHITSVVPDGDGFLLSLFTAEPKSTEIAWHDTPLNEGLILRCGPDRFIPQQIATDIYAPHSLRKHDNQLWWCDSFRHTVCRDDGWQSPDLGGFTRGLTFNEQGQCIVGLSRVRIDPHPFADVCGICTFDPDNPAAFEVVELDETYIEVSDVIAVDKHDSRSSKFDQIPDKETCGAGFPAC